MRFLINVFIIIHCLLITAWLFPVNPGLVSVRHFFKKYIVFLGLDQNYSMFAPAVRKTNRYVTVVITFANHLSTIWTYPRIENMGLIEAAKKERYRKFANDNMMASAYKMFLPDFARYIARFYACADNEPEYISIYLCEKDIPSPSSKSVSVSESAKISPWRLTNIFTYQVVEEDLK